MWKVNAWFFIFVAILIGFLFVSWYARVITTAAAELAVKLDTCIKEAGGN